MSGPPDDGPPVDDPPVDNPPGSGPVAEGPAVTDAADAGPAPHPLRSTVTPARIFFTLTALTSFLRLAWGSWGSSGTAPWADPYEWVILLRTLGHAASMLLAVAAWRYTRAVLAAWTPEDVDAPLISRRMRTVWVWVVLIQFAAVLSFSLLWVI